MAVHRSPNGDYLGLICDTCETAAPPSKLLLEKGGLTRMGWYCWGGTHICDECPHPRTPEQVLADRRALQPARAGSN